MSITITSELSSVQIQQIQNLIRASREKEPVTASFPFEEADFFAFLEEDGAIRSAAAVIREDDTACECCAFTDPAYRRQGLFHELLDAVIDELPEDTELLFYTNGKSPDCLAALEALEAEVVLEEHMMELQLDRFEKSADSPQSPVQASEELLDGTKTLIFRNAHGTVNISVFRDYYYLYGLEIHESMRGRGLGHRLLTHVLSILAERDPLPLRLQVSGNNLPALSLYRKTGFQITETLFCYLY